MTDFLKDHSACKIDHGKGRINMEDWRTSQKSLLVYHKAILLAQMRVTEWIWREVDRFGKYSRN